MPTYYFEMNLEVYPNSRCVIPQCDTAPPFEQKPSWWPNNTIDRCTKPLLKENGSICTNDSFSDQVEECTEWVYENSDSVVAEVRFYFVLLTAKPSR